MPNRKEKRQKKVVKSVVLVGHSKTINSQTITVLAESSAGYVRWCTGTVTITGAGAGYEQGCKYDKDYGDGTTSIYYNEGDETSCSFTLAETVNGSEALTATADGLTTGLMSGKKRHAIVTSASATNAITLPASSTALLGKQFTIWVGANGFELLTPASSNATINGTDSDGTNQADIPANSLSRLTLVNTNTWILENIGSTGTVAAAIVPDND